MRERKMNRLIIFVMLAFTLLCKNTPSNVQAIYFDDSDPNMIVVGNAAYYEIGFRKSNGSIAYIVDNTTGQAVTSGSRYECLWGAVFPKGTPDFVGGCSYNATGMNSFKYSWLSATHTLSLDFIPDPAVAQGVEAHVTVTIAENNSFDMQMTLQNNWGHRLDYVLFPSDLVFANADIEEVLLPVLPGVILESSFFQQGRSYTTNYPGYPGTFADYVSVSSRKGQLAIYSLYGDNPIRPVILGLIDDDAYMTDTTFYYHTFGAGVRDGQTWTTPTVRLRVSQPHLETIKAYRQDNYLNQWASVRSKSEPFYPQLVQSPLLKADAEQLAIPFPQYANLLTQVPAPAILHPVAFQPKGHDENYPDFLPPDSAWGTTADFATMMQQAQAQGFLVMPYTNPTWWDDESPTLQALPPGLTIRDLAIWDDSDEPVYERYGSQQEHGGYVMSPYVPFVQQRLQQLVDALTVDVSSDLLFEDQIGARAWRFDNNPLSPHLMAYIEGWLAHTQRYHDTFLMTELGFDRLAETEVGFHGSILLPKRLGYTDSWWGDSNWHPYPLAPLMLRDKVLFYQHDLAYETFTTNKETLLWNVAFGYMLSYDLVQTPYGGGVNSEWLDLVSVLQKNVLSRYAHEELVSYERQDENVTRSLFENYEVLANWNNVSSVVAGENELPPLGLQITSADGSVTAGIFHQYNGHSLSPGDHYLVEERQADGIIVYQPIGTNTALTLDLLPSWEPDDVIEVSAFTEDGVLIERRLAIAASQGITFTYQRQAAGHPVAYYKLKKILVWHQFLPLSSRSAANRLRQTAVFP